jgi:hypothetical protein
MTIADWAFVISALSLALSFVTIALNFERRRRNLSRCPHGYTDWDQCSDCSH